MKVTMNEANPKWTPFWIFVKKQYTALDLNELIKWIKNNFIELTLLIRYKYKLYVSTI